MNKQMQIWGSFGLPSHCKLRGQRHCGDEGPQGMLQWNQLYYLSPKQSKTCRFKRLRLDLSDRSGVAYPYERFAMQITKPETELKYTYLESWSSSGVVSNEYGHHWGSPPFLYDAHQTPHEDAEISGMYNFKAQYDFKRLGKINECNPAGFCRYGVQRAGLSEANKVT
jgi:hypothetical protein